jgi:tetratricopeptide (TPR) repeat protein
MKLRVTLILVFLAAFLVTVPALAEIKTFTHTVKQPFGGSQSPDDARIAAMTKAKREVLEMAGVYLESLTIVKESVVEKDEILALSAGILKAEIVSQKNYATDEAFGIVVTAKVDVNTGVMKERVAKMLKDRSLLEKYQELQKRERELLARIDRLELKNRELRTSSKPNRNQQEEQLKKQFQKATKELTAVELTRKALSLLSRDKTYTNLERALKYLNEAIRLDPNYSAAHINRGIAWHNKGDYERALADFNRAIAINPRLVQGYNNRGAIWVSKKDYDRAMRDFNRGLEIDPKCSEIYYNRGMVWLQKDEFRRAINDYSKAIQLNSRSYKTYMAYFQRGNARKGIEDFSRAIDDFTVAIQLNPTFWDAYLERGKVFLIKTDYNRAIEDFTKFIELRPKLADGFKGRGMARSRNGDLDGTLADFLKIMEIEPDNNITPIHIALIYSTKNNASETCRWLQVAIKNGFHNRQWLKQNKSFDSIRDSQCFRQIIRSQ